MIRKLAAAAVAAAALALPAAAGAAGTLKVTLTAHGHTPKINVKWWYVVHATVDGKPAAARLTEVIVDPIGGIHPVEVGPSTRKITNFPFKGSYRDYLVFPAASRDVPVTFRVTVKVGSLHRTIDYSITPKG